MKKPIAYVCLHISSKTHHLDTEKTLTFKPRKQTDFAVKCSELVSSWRTERAVELDVLVEPPQVVVLPQPRPAALHLRRPLVEGADWQRRSARPGAHVQRHVGVAVAQRRTDDAAHAAAQRPVQSRLVIASGREEIREQNMHLNLQRHGHSFLRFLSLKQTCFERQQFPCRVRYLLTPLCCHNFRVSDTTQS